MRSGRRARHHASLMLLLLFLDGRTYLPTSAGSASISKEDSSKIDCRVQPMPRRPAPTSDNMFRPSILSRGHRVTQGSMLLVLNQRLHALRAMQHDVPVVLDQRDDAHPFPVAQVRVAGNVARNPRQRLIPAQLDRLDRRDKRNAARTTGAQYKARFRLVCEEWIEQGWVAKGSLFRSRHGKVLPEDI